LKRSEERLQEYAIRNSRFYLKKRWTCSDLGDATQGQTDDISK